MTKKKQKSVIKKHVRNTRRKTALALVPKKENQYRPHAIRRYGIVAVISLAIMLQMGYNLTKTGSVLGQVVNISPNGLLVATNDRRAEEHVGPLRMNDNLSQAAMLKANDIIQNQYWSHISPSGVNPWSWISGAGYTYAEAGENLAKGFSTADGVVAGWMDSEAHRANLLKESYTDVGFAVTTGELHGTPTTVIVALYAKPAENKAAALTNSYAVSAASGESGQTEEYNLSPAARIGIAIQSLTPAAVTSVALLFMAGTIAITSHAYRRKLPKKLQKTWYKDHGAIKAAGLFAIAAFIILLYGAGQL